MQTIEDVRRDRLALLEKEAGSQANLSKIIEKSPAQISQWKNASQTTSGRKRAMHSDTAREIEEKVGKPRGWMDTPLSYGEATPAVITIDAALDTMMVAIDELPLDQREQVSKALAVLALAPDSANTRAQVLSALKNPDNSPTNGHAKEPDNIKSSPRQAKSGTSG